MALRALVSRTGKHARKSWLSLDSNRTYGAGISTVWQTFHQSSIHSPAGYSTSAMQVEQSYARDVQEYNQVMFQLVRQKKPYTLRDAYEDMLMDGITPNRDTFHIAIPGCMKAQRLQDAFFFFKEMKSLGMQPDIVLYNCLISTCGRCVEVDKAFQVAQEMESSGIAPKLRTFVALLNACGTAGRVNEAHGVVQRMSAYGLRMNKYCYGALINAYKNRRPIGKDTFKKMFELLEESKDKDVEDDDAAMEKALGQESDSHDDIEEEQGLVGRGNRNPAQRELVVHHAAMRAMVDLGNYEGALRVVKDVEDMGMKLDAYLYMQLVKAHLNEGKVDKAIDSFDYFIGEGGFVTLDLYVGLIERAILKYSSESMAMAKRLLLELDNRFFLNTRMGGHLLSLASRERHGDFSVASLIFEMVTKNQNQRPPYQGAISFLRGLRNRGVPDDDPRVLKAKAIVDERQADWKGYFTNSSNKSGKSPEHDIEGTEKKISVDSESSQEENQPPSPQ